MGSENGADGLLASIPADLDLDRVARLTSGDRSHEILRTGDRLGVEGDNTSPVSSPAVSAAELGSMSEI